MIDIEIEAHPDRVGRHQMVNITVLIKVDLGVAGARAERAKNHRCPPLLAADQLGNGIDIIDREPDDCGTWRHAGYLARPGIGQLRKPLAAQERHFRHKRVDCGAHRIGPKKQGFLCAAGVQQPFREHMATLGVGA